MHTQQEYVNGQLKNKYGDAFIRGNNGAWWRACMSKPTHAPAVLYISPADP